MNIKHWTALFEKEFNSSPHALSKQEVFFRFCKRNFEKSINLLRGNGEYEPVIERIIRYVVRAKIKEKQSDRMAYSDSNYSRSNSTKRSK